MTDEYTKDIAGALERLKKIKEQRPFFDNKKVSEPQRCYVAWLDIMGTRSHMQRSMRVLATFMGRFHSAVLLALDATKAKVGIYPIVDGVYLVSSELQPLLSYVQEAMKLLALTFVLETEEKHRFMVRGGLAFGPVADGESIRDACDVLGKNYDNHTSALLLGAGVGNAYEAEHSASPFGIWVHDTARIFAPTGKVPFARTHWRWWEKAPSDQKTYDDLAVVLSKMVPQYLAWCADHHTWLTYDPKAVDRHRELALQYFSGAAPA